MACCGPGLPQKVEYLKTTPFLLLSPNGESDESISELAKLCVVSTLGKGKPFALPKQVEGGAFALCCTGGLGNPSSSELSHKPGDFWHSSSSMTVLFAKEKSRLLFVPMSAIETILAKKSDKLLRAIVELNISAILDEVPYMKLANLEKDSLEALKPLFMFEAFADGKAVYETGEPADRLYILVHGDIAVTDKDGKVVRTFHAPNFFGATAMLDAKAKRTFTASASGGAAALLSLSRDKLRLFKECFKESGTQLETLMFQEARGRMLTTTLMKGGLLSEAENAGKFKDPGEQVARYIALGGCIHCHPRIPAGEPLIAEGAVAPAVFFVYQGKLYPRAYTPPVAEREEPAEIRRGSSQSAMAGKSPRTSSTKEGAKDKGSTPRQEGIKDKAKKADAPEEPDDSLTTGKYVGELGVLKGHQEASPYTAGPGLVALAADGESLKRLLELVPTFRAHLTLRCVDSDRMGYDAVFNYPSASDAMLAHMKSEYSDEAWYFERDSAAWVTTAKGLPPGDPELLKTAQAMSEEFIVSDSPHQINIPADCQKKILKQIEDGKVDATLLDDARKEMRKLTERDTLPRLRKGEAFRELVQGLGRYPEALQFENDKALTTAIDKAAASAAAFPVYHHAITEGDGDWRQFEVDM